MEKCFLFILFNFEWMNTSEKFRDFKISCIPKLRVSAMIFIILQSIQSKDTLSKYFNQPHLVPKKIPQPQCRGVVRNLRVQVFLIFHSCLHLLTYFSCSLEVWVQILKFLVHQYNNYRGYN